MKKNGFLQTGWNFFPEIINDGARIQDLSYDEDIYQSLRILFTTLPGQRIGQQLYGCDLMQYVFKGINNSLISNMENTIRTAITLYEPRIKLIKLDINVNTNIPHRVDINLIYILSRTNSRYNITIPFYTMEGVNYLDEEL
jgi:phage baseplate assembly protein W